MYFGHLNNTKVSDIHQSLKSSPVSAIEHKSLETSEVGAFNGHYMSARSVLINMSN